MFRLEQLDIHGFKSFYDPAKLTFPEAMTAVVGPNGCGKSNICDALIWVLGETAPPTSVAKRWRTSSSRVPRAAGRSRWARYAHPRHEQRRQRSPDGRRREDLIH